MDIIIIIVAIVFFIFMIYSMTKYAKFIHHYPHQTEGEAKPDDKNTMKESEDDKQKD